MTESTENSDLPFANKIVILAARPFLLYFSDTNLFSKESFVHEPGKNTRTTGFS